MDLRSLIEKYSQPGPRYTSYPTAPQWDCTIGGVEYEAEIRKLRKDNDGLALYVHIPFCESLCYYCGCNIEVTKNRELEYSYVESCAKEIALISASVDRTQNLNQISWGGGTPTYLSLGGIQKLFHAIMNHFRIQSDAEISIEVDPRVTSTGQLQELRSLGFNRISLGVQDFDSTVQKAVHRVQPPLETKAMLTLCRSLGFRGINFDLIYGLPLQTLESFEKTLQLVIEMGPDRIALYNYAHLPNLIAHQKVLEKYLLPSPSDRVAIFELAYRSLTGCGYHSIGMDHFAKPSDELVLCSDALYRNFMGYTIKRSSQLIGIGCSAISEINGCYFQNHRNSSEYQASITQDKLATFRGCSVSDDDQRRKWIIQSLLCGMGISFDSYEEHFGESFENRFGEELKSLKTFEADAVLKLNSRSIQVTPIGKIFVRNIAMVFDAYLSKPSEVRYSKTV